MSNISFTQSIQLGVLLGALLAIPSFLFIPAYHDFIMMQWNWMGQHWMLWAPASAAIGVYLAVITD